MLGTPSAAAYPVEVQSLKSMKERVREALDKMPDDLPLSEFLDGLHRLIQIQSSLDDIEQGNTISNEEVWKQRPWRR